MILKNPLKTKEIAELVNGRLIGSSECFINGFNRIEYASEGELTFLYNPKYKKYLSETNASCIIIYENIESQPKEGQSYILVDKPYESFVGLLQYIESQNPKIKAGIHPTAKIESNVRIAVSASIGAGCFIGSGCSIGENTVLKPNAVLYDDVSIGSGTTIHSNVVCYSETIIGSNCIIHAGAVIGSDGFGYLENKDGSYTKIPQLGNVIIKDNVEIGANTTIDRALVGSTVIEEGCKIDNLVQVAHNVVIGENTGIASQAGISGSVKIGKRNRLAGQSGVSGHIELADDITLYAQSGVAAALPEKGIYFGSPARSRMRAFRIEGAINQLPELFAELNQLKKKFAEIQKPE